jgi:uncharacterized membrane protein YedE/YeeE
VHAAIFWRVIMQRKAPVYDDHFHFPTNPVIDKELLAGSALFGIGWAIGTSRNCRKAEAPNLISVCD